MKTKINNICCIGVGYAGVSNIALITKQCPDIKDAIVDINKAKIVAWNSNNFDDLPLHETGLANIIKQTLDKNIFFFHRYR